MAAPLAALILTGGASRRMGRDKGLLLYQGKPLVKRAYDALALQVPTFVSLRRKQATAYGQILNKSRLIYDRHMRMKGPLLGLLSAHLEYPHYDFLVTAVDLPLVNRHLIKRLFQARAHLGVHNYVAICFANEVCQPMPAIYSRKALATVLLQRNHFSLKGLLANAYQLTLSEAETKQLVNVNQPQAFWSLPR